MMKQLSSKLETTTSSLDSLTKTVGDGRTIKFNYDKVNQHVGGLLDKKLSQAVQAPVQRVERTLEGFEQRVAEIGTQKVSEASKKVEKVLDETKDLVFRIDRAERHLKDLEGRMTWTVVGRLCLALIPLAVVLLVVGGLTMGVFHTLGFGPLLGWAWASFMNTDIWWAKALIAVATLSAVAVFTSIVWWLAKKLREDFFRRW
ncbi:hypothetical protein [Schaalia sp. ZJ405]|uniref:hypothetical protein n=1 Tax=Schaalia sp. ZJ405 TaxID=2709403 RepID=UPI0018C9A199|nr:hypothetical protein [Schaalia sp. ZJ405]